MKVIQIITPILIALAISTFSACSSSNSSNDTNTTLEDTNSTDTNSTDTNNTDPISTKSYIINETENKDIPIDAQIKSVSTTQAKVKLTRNIEDQVVNVHVISGSVEVTEAIE